MAANDIDQMIAQLANSGNFIAPTLSSAPSSAPHVVSYTDFAPKNTDSNMYTDMGVGVGGGAPANPNANLPLWRQALNQLDKPRAVVDNLLNDVVQNNPTKGLKGAAEDFIGLNPLVNSATLGLPMGITALLDPNAVKSLGNTHPLQDIKQGLTNDPGSAQFGNILDNLGYKAPAQNAPEWQKIAHGAANLVGNIATDPLTYVTLGAGGAAKAGVEAATDTALGIAKNAGVDVAKGAGKDIGKLASGTASNIYDKTLQDAATQGINPDLAERLAQKKFSDTYNQILNAGKAARAKAGQSLLNVDIPFTNISKSILNKPSFMQVTESKIAEEQAQAVRNALSAMKVPDPAAQDALLASKYGQGVTAETMTPQMLKDFQQTVSSVPQAKAALPDATIEQQMVQHEIPQPPTVTYNPYNLDTSLASVDPRIAQQVSDVLKAAGSPVTTPEILGASRSMLNNVDELRKTAPDVAQYGQDVVDASHTMKGKTAQAVQQGYQDLANSLANATHTASITENEPKIVQEMIQQAIMRDPTAINNANQVRALEQAFAEMPYVADKAGHTPLGHWFNNSILGKINPRVGKGANEVWDTQGAIAGQQFNLAHDIAPQMQKELKQLTPAERTMLLHISENDIPKNLSASEQAALDAYKTGTGNGQLMKDIIAKRQSGYQEMLQNEIKAGTMSPERALQNYEYHMVNPDKGMSEEDLQKLFEDPIVQKYGGRSAVNKSNVERGQFKTLAQWRNAVDAIRGEVAKETDPVAKAALQDHLSKLENLYETDPLKNYTARAERSIRTSNYGSLFNDLKNQGFIRDSVGNLSKDTRDRYVHMSGDTNGKIAKMMGLQEGQWVHKDILNNLKKVDRVFQGENMNHFIDNLNSVMNIWKAGPILYSPTHYKTRFVGDLMNSMLGGAKLNDFKDAMRISKAAKDGTLSGEDAKLYKLAIDHGIMRSHSGQLADIIGTNVGAGNKIQNIENKVYNNAVGKKMGAGLNYMDNQSRLALFLRGMKSYGNPSQAADLTRKYMFNYNELSGADKAIRTAVPFWTWTRNNLPLMIQQFGTQPRYFQAYNRLATQLQGTQPTEPYANDYLHVGGDNFFNPRAPLQDLDMLDHPWQQILGNMLNPIAMTPAETYTNMNFFDRMPIDKYAISGNPASIKASLGFLAQQMGAGGASNLMNTATETNKPMWERVFNDAIGGMSQQNPASIAKENNYLRQQALTEQRKQAKAQAQASGG